MSAAAKQDDSWFSPALLAKLRSEAPLAESTSFAIEVVGDDPKRASGPGSGVGSVPSLLLPADDPAESPKPDDHGHVPPLKRQPREERSAASNSTPGIEADGLPLSSPYQLDPGLVKAIREAPPEVAAFIPHVPKDPPAWRYTESEGERAQRELFEAQGCWTG